MAQVEHAPFCLDSLVDYVEDGDDFWGDSLDARWDASGSAGGSIVVVDGVDGGVIRVTAPAGEGNGCTLNWKVVRSLHVNKRLIIEFRARLVQTTTTQVRLSARRDSSNRMNFYYNVTIDAFWHIVNTNNDSSTDLATLNAVDTDWHTFRIECSPTEIHYYIDGVECSNSPITTDIPADAAYYLEPHVWVSTRSSVEDKSLDIDYIWWRQER